MNGELTLDDAMASARRLEEHIDAQNYGLARDESKRLVSALLDVEWPDQPEGPDA